MSGYTPAFQKTITILVKDDGTIRIFEPYVYTQVVRRPSIDTKNVKWAVEDLLKRITELRDELGYVEEEPKEKSKKDEGDPLPPYSAEGRGFYLLG